MKSFTIGFVTVCLVTINTSGESVYNNFTEVRTVYEYIIVGAGSAGSVIANRLSEDENVTVLLIEAGGPPPPVTDIPMECFDILGKPDTDWNYYTEPQLHACLELPEQKCYWSRFKGLGGCSSHNTMFYARGNREDYDGWESQGATGWGWNDVLPLFKKIEDFRFPRYASNGYHGNDGYLTISPPVYTTRLHDVMLEAGKELGHDPVDYNGPSQKGISVGQFTQRDGLRCSTEKAYLRPVLSRPNLDILPFARALKIMFDDDKTARHVVFSRNNMTQLATASKEIILSAGAVGSPHLLLLSGVGPREQLRQFNIPVVADLPVGQNLQDQPHVSGLIWKMNDSVAFVPSRDVNNESLGELREGKGPYTTAHGSSTIVFTNSKYQDKNETRPDIEIYPFFTPFTMTDLHYQNCDAITLLPILLHPKTRGNLRLKSSDPYVDPIIDHQYLSDESDALPLIEGIKFARKIVETKAFQRYDPTPVNTTKGCENLDWNSEEYLNCTVWRSVVNLHHFAGSNRMGNLKDPTTVVDHKLRVKGLKGLRVADASIMPSLPSGNINAACIMIGEKASNLIKGY